MLKGFASTTTTVTFVDLEPGLELVCSIDYHFGAGGSHGTHLGTGENVVDENGQVQFAIPTHQLSRGHQGSAKAWVHPKGTPFGAPPVQNVHGVDAVFVFHLP